MNFFEHQALARRQTRRMLWMFAAAVLAIVALIDGVVLFALGLDAGFHAVSGRSGPALVVVGLIVVAVIATGSLYRIATLAGGGAAVPYQLGAVPVPPDGGNFAYRRLRNIVEEIAIASGVPVPQVFVLEEEAGINAFASGFAPADAAITVTRGALEKLTRAELQGVIGHEFSHILNGDMRLNIRLMGVVFGIVVIATIGRRIAEVSGRGRSRDAGAAVMFGLAVFAAGYIGVVFARMIKASISRQREFLADASAVQFTRQTEGIAGALKKIGSLSAGAKLDSADREEVAHMLFGDGVGYSALFATHPPLLERIRRLDPAFAKSEFSAIAAAWERPLQVGEHGGSEASIAGFAPATTVSKSPSASRQRGLPSASAEFELSPPAVVRQVGNPGDDDREVAQAIRAMIPQALRAAARDPQRAIPLVFALLLNDEADVRSRQLASIERRCDAGTCALAGELHAGLADLHPMQRLPLASLAFPTLRRRPRPQLATFMLALRELIDADGQVTLAEYCLAHLIGTQVVDFLDSASAKVIGRMRLPKVAAELRDVLAIVARHGNEDPVAARRAYVSGLAEVLPQAKPDYSPPPDWRLALDRALPKLDLLAPAGKELVVCALTRSITADGKVTVAEAELLRTICAALHCPLPPLLQSEG